MSSDIKKESNGIQILKEQKQVLDLRFCNILNDNKIAPKYYFADLNGNRLSKSYYSIDKLHDGIHYLVSELDFMFSLDLNEWLSINGGECDEDINYFKFHFGIVSVIDGKITEVVPAIYKDIYETNSNVVFVQADDYYTHNFTSGGGQNFTNVKAQLLKRKTKVGCINLDLESNSYGMNIIIPIMDHIEDFDLAYKGFAYASVGDFSGYLSKEIDQDRYNDFIQLYANLIKGNISTRVYYDNVNKALSKILYTEEEVKDIINNYKYKKLEKKISKL